MHIIQSSGTSLQESRALYHRPSYAPVPLIFLSSWLVKVGRKPQAKSNDEEKTEVLEGRGPLEASVRPLQGFWKASEGHGDPFKALCWLLEDYLL